MGNINGLGPSAYQQTSIQPRQSVATNEGGPRNTVGFPQGVADSRGVSGGDGVRRLIAGQPIPPDYEVLLTPQDQKKLYEQGYLDVQKKFSVMESNEGAFSLLGKSLACVFGPSKSIGAIKIDPMFMEMIKDPNAQVGFGYTRVRNESLQVLPSPEIPPRPESPVPPPPVLTPQTPPQHTRPERPPTTEETPWNPVTMAREQTLYSLSMSARWRGVGNKSGQQMGEHKTNVQDSTLSASFQEMLGWSGQGLKPSQHAVINAHMVKLFTGDMAQQNSYDQAAYILNDTALSTRTQWEGQRVDTTHRTKNGNTEVNQRSSNHQYHFFVDQHRSIPLTGSDLTQYAQLTGKSEAELSAQTPKPNMYDLYIATNKSMNLGETPTTSDAGTNQGRLQNTYKQLYQRVTGQSVPEGFDFKKVSMEDVYALRILSDGMSKTNGRISAEQARSAITLNGDGSLEIKDDAATRNMLKGLVGAPRGQNPNSSELIASYRLNLESNFAREGGRTFQFTQNDTDSVMTALRPNLERDGLTAAQITEAHITEEDAAGLSISSMDKDNQMEGIGRRNTFNANGTMVRADLIHGTEAASLPKQELPTGAQYNAINANMNRLEGFTQMNHMSNSYDRGAVRNTIKAIEGQIKTLSDAGDPNVQKYQTELNRLRGLDNAMRGQYVERGGPGGTPSRDAVVANITVNLQNLAKPGISNANIQAADNYIRPLIQSLGENAAPPGNKVTLNGKEYSGTWAQILDQVKTTAAQGVSQPGGSVPATGEIPVGSGGETPIGVPPVVTAGENVTTGVASNTPVTNGNTTVSATTPATAGQTFYKADEVIASIENDLAVLKGLKTKIDSGVQVNPQSVANFVNSINKKLTILATPGATDLPVGADGKVVLPAKVTQLTAEYDALNKGVIIDYVSKANAAAATRASNSGNYEADVNNSLKEFRQHLNTYMKDKSLSVEEGAHLQRFIDETSVNLGNHARSLGIDMAGLIDDRGQAVGRPQDIMSRLSGLDDATIKSSYKAKTGQDMPDNQLQELKRTFDSVQSVQANVNLLNGEIRDVIALNKNIKTLNQRLDEFESLGVAKTAFQGEMKDLAQKQSGVFATMMQHAYGFQTPPTLTPEGKLDTAAPANAGYVNLMNMALGGGLPVPPNVGFVDRAQLGGANAAYVPKEGEQTQPMILIASDLADPSKSHQLKEAFAEEMFHHLERSQGVQQLAVADARATLGNLGLNPDERPEDLSALSSEAQKAYNDLSAAQAGGWDAGGDEGRAALFALRQVNSGNVSVNNGRIDTNRLAAEANRGRNERANVSAAAIDQTGVAADQGKANADIRDSQGNVVVRAGARMEFSSSPASATEQPATEEATEVTPTATTQATTAAAPTGYADKAQYQELFNDLAKEYKPKLAALDSRNAPAEEYQRLLGQMQSQFSGNSQMPIALDWQRGEIFGSLPSSRVGPQSEATFTTAAGRQKDDPRQPDHNFNYGSDVDAPPINPHASRSVPMQELYNRGNFGETNGANQFQQTNQTVSQNFAPPEPEGFVNKFVDTLSNVGKGTLKSLPDIGSGMETAGKMLANFADQWRKQIQELWFGPNGVCANLSAYSLTAHNVIYGEGGGPGNDRDKLMEGGTEHMFNKVTSQVGAPNYDRVRQELSEKDKQYRKDMDLRRSAQEMASSGNKPRGLGF